jgi:uncharacterized protein
MSQTLNLYRLQQIDSQIDRFSLRVQEIQKNLDDDIELRTLSEEVDNAKSRCTRADLVLKKAETDVKNQVIKIEQTQSSLYGRESHSPKELQDLQKDVASLKRHLIILEDMQIEAMQESETAEEDYQKTMCALKAGQEKRLGLNMDLKKEMDGLQIDIERAHVEREAVSEVIPPPEISLYNQLRQQRRGVAVATIKENSCGVCGSTLSLAQIQSARSAGKMMLCPSCGRILYGK